MDKNSVDSTTPTPTPTSSSPRCGSSPAWSAATIGCGSAPDGRDSFPPFALLGFVAETHRSSYVALPKTSPPPRNESPSAREGLVSTIYKIGFVAATHRTSYEALSKRVSPQLRPPRNESPSAREGLVSTIYKIGFVAVTHRTSYDAFFETSPPPRNESPFGREGLVPTICQIGFVAATHRSSYVALPKTSPPPRNESPIPAAASKSCLPNQLSQYTIDTQTQVLVDGGLARQGTA